MLGFVKLLSKFLKFFTVKLFFSKYFIKPRKDQRCMIESDDDAQGQMVKEYVSNAKKFYDHLETCESCRKNMGEIWHHVYTS